MAADTSGDASESPPDPPTLEDRRPGILHTTRRGAVLGALGLVATAAALWWAGGPLGVVGALVAATAWVLLGAPAAVAVTNVALLAVADPSLTQIAAVEAAAASILLGDLLGQREPLRLGVVFLAVAGLLGGVVWVGSTTTEAIWLPAAALVVVGTVLGYGVYRYERVATGQVEVSEQ